MLIIFAPIAPLVLTASVKGEFSPENDAPAKVTVPVRIRHKQIKTESDFLKCLNKLNPPFSLLILHKYSYYVNSIFLI